MFKSTNGGGSWSAVNSGLNNAYVTALVIDPLTPTTLYAETGSGVFKSTDGGGSWWAVNSGLPTAEVDALAIDPLTPTTLYVGIYRSGVFKSIDGGGNWSAINSGLTSLNVRELAVHPLTPATVYAGTVAGVFRLNQGAPVVAVPTLSGAGLAALALLLAGGALVVLRRS